MAPQPLSETTRYIAPEVTVVYQVETVASLSSPQRSELDHENSVDLTGEIAAMDGWTTAADRVAVPDLGTRFTGRISGRVNPGDAQITYYASQDTVDIRDTQERGDRFYIYILYGGDVEGQKMNGFEVEVSAVSPTTGVAGTEAERVMVDYSIVRTAENISIPGES